MSKKEEYEIVSKFMNDINKKEDKTIIEKYILTLQTIVNRLKLELLDVKYNVGYLEMGSDCVEELADDIERLFKDLFGNIDMNYAYEKIDNRKTFTIELTKMKNPSKNLLGYDLLGSVCLKADNYSDALSKAEDYYTKANNLNVVEGSYSLCELDKINKVYPSRYLYVESNIMNTLDDTYELRVVDVE